MIVAADRESMVLLSGSGEVITPEEPLLAVGSGGPYALAAAKALYRHTGLSAKEQRILAKTIKRARILGLLPFTEKLVRK